MGLYGVLSQLVCVAAPRDRRAHGARRAAGADPVASVVWQAATVTAVGIAVGLAGALALARFMTTLVFGIPARDPLTFAIGPLLLALVAGVTAFIPARRAARVDPMTSLRDG